MPPGTTTESDAYDPWYCCLGYAAQWTSYPRLFSGTGQGITADAVDGTVIFVNLEDIEEEGDLPASVVPFNCWSTYCTGGANCVFVPRIADARQQWKNPPGVPSFTCSWISDVTGTGEFLWGGGSTPQYLGWDHNCLKYYFSSSSYIAWGGTSGAAYEAVYSEELSNCTPNEKPCCENTVYGAGYSTQGDCELYGDDEYAIFDCASYTHCQAEGGSCEYWWYGDCVEIEGTWYVAYSLEWDSCSEEF